MSEEVVSGVRLVVERLEAKGILSHDDTQAIVEALHVNSSAPHSDVAAGPAPAALAGPYWEKRFRALHDREFVGLESSAEPTPFNVNAAAA